MKFLQLLLVVVLNFAFTQEDGKEKLQDFQKVELVSSTYFFTLKGNIDEKYPITIKLVASPDEMQKGKYSLKGIYFFDSREKDIPIKGSMDKNSLEFSAESRSEKFTFQLQEGDLEKIFADENMSLAITGQWQGAKEKDKILKVTLSEVELLNELFSRLDKYVLRGQRTGEISEEAKEIYDDIKGTQNFFYEESVFFLKPMNIAIINYKQQIMSFESFEKRIKEIVQKYIFGERGKLYYKAHIDMEVNIDAIAFRSKVTQKAFDDDAEETYTDFRVFFFDTLSFWDCRLADLVEIDTEFTLTLQEILDSGFEGEGLQIQDDAVKSATCSIEGDFVKIYFINSDIEDMLVPRDTIKSFLKKQTPYRRFFD